MPADITNEVLDQPGPEHQWTEEDAARAAVELGFDQEPEDGVQLEGDDQPEPDSEGPADDTNEES